MHKIIETNDAVRIARDKVYRSNELVMLFIQLLGFYPKKFDFFQNDVTKSTKRTSEKRLVHHVSNVCIYIILILMFLIPCANAVAIAVGEVNPGPGNYITDCAGTYSPCTANDVAVDPNSYAVVDSSGHPLTCLDCQDGTANAFLKLNYQCTANERYNVFLIFFIGTTQYRVCLADTITAAQGIKTVQFPISWQCDQPLVLTGPSPCGGPILTWSQDKKDAGCSENQAGGITDCHGGSKCFCYPQKTVPSPCRAVAPSFSICKGTTISDQLFIDHGATCGGGCSGTYTNNINTNVPGTYQYTIICATDSCSSSRTGTVTVNDIPSCVITAPISVCESTDGLLASVPSFNGATYAWTVSGDGASVSGANTQALTWQTTTKSTGTVHISVTVTGPEPTRCSCTSSVDIPVNARPSSTITAPTSVCFGSTGNTASVADAGTGATYAWTITGGTITSKMPYTNSITWTAGSSGTVTLGVTVTTAAGCTGESDPLVILPGPAPTIAIGTPDKQLNCSGVCPILTATVIGTIESYTIAWSKDGQPFAGTGLTIQPCEAGAYTAVVTDSSTGCTGESDPLAILPGPAPTITAQPVSIIVCKDKEASFTVMATGTGTLQYQWYHETTALTDDELISGSTTDTLTMKNLTEADAGEYHVVVMDGPCSNVSDIATLTVETGPSCITPGVAFKISGTKYEDLNGDVTKDDFDPGLPGWTIYLDDNNNGVLDEGEISNVTDANGKYLFERLTSSTYIVREVPQTGWTQTAPVKGFADVTLTAQDPVQTVDFGNWITSSSLVVTKTTPSVTLIPNMETYFTITVQNTGKIEIHDLKIVDEPSPMLEFIPYAYCGDFLIQHTFDGGNLIFDLSSLGSLPPGDSWTVVYNVKLSPNACSAASTPISLPTIASADETKLKVMGTVSSPADLLPIIDALSRNKTKLEAKLESIKKKRDTFNKTSAVLESKMRSIAATNYTLINYTNISTGETLNEQLNATGFLILSEYTRPAKFDQLTTTYDTKGEVISDLYTFLPTKETLKIEYNKPDEGYRTCTVRYYATGDTLIMTINSYGMVVFREYKRTPGLAEPEHLTNCVTANGNAGGQDRAVVSNRACVNLGWSCQTPQPLLRLLVFKEADREVAKPGDNIRYKYTVVNNGTIVLTSLTLNDDKLGIIVLNDPDPLQPGESRTYYANYSVKAEDGPKLENIVIATASDPDGNKIESKANESVEIITNTICLTKTASPKVVRPGDYVTYNITWDGSTSGDLIVDDYPGGVTFISASPTPIDDGNNNKWKIDGLIPGTITILVQVAKDIGNISFDMNQGVTGTGFVNVHNDIRTNPLILKNKATLYENKIEKCTASADVNVGPPQTYVALKEHGSGDYASEDVIKYQNSNRSIQRTKGLTATHKPTTFSLPNNRDVDFMSKWSEKAEAKNYATGGSTNEEYTYASRINQSSSLKLDENGSTMKTETDFEGVGHIGLIKKDANENRTWNASDIFQSQEDYVGRFSINQKFDEYGKNAEYEKTVNGTGYVSAKRDLGNAQSSYESGTGNYQSDEKISTVVNYIAKDINLTHLPTSYIYTPTFSTYSDIKWKEGMWSKTPTSLISERFSSAENLNLQSTARGLNEMVTEARVTGQADFRTVYKQENEENDTDEVDQDETYVGEFDIQRKTTLGGVAKYDRPHISLSKMAIVDLLNTTYADYRIIIENNGNRALEPVYVKDVFPTGTEYITSSLRPAELTTSYANWSLPVMGIGSKVIIDLRLNITQEPSNLINRVEAAGNYGNGWTIARNFSVSNLNWLTCCPPQISASKTARIDAQNPKVVWYSLNLKNREKYTMVAFLMDQLPAFMKLLNSSQEPSENRSDLITWTILDLAPGENRTIVYRAMAESDGVYVNVAHIEAFSVDGPDGAAADVESRVDIGVGGALPSSISSDWQPPTCFGLNCSDQIRSDDWIPCYNCAAGEPGNAMSMPTCASCMSTGDDSLP
jgi:hypothetical protein